MLGIFKKGLAHPPQELNSPNPSKTATRQPKFPREILEEFMASHQPSSSNAFSVSFEDGAALTYAHPPRSYSVHQRLFCGLDNIYCIFGGSLNNLCSLIKQYGLSKGTDEAMFVIEAYRTLRDRGPYPADQVLKDLDGDYGFVLYDSKAGTIFAASGAGEGVRLFWGIAADGSLVISDNLEIVKGSCAKSFAPFPAGCMFHSEHGLMSFEHPRSKVKAMPRIDSEGVMCGANFKVDVQSKVHAMPRVGSEANWAIWGQNA
ncbi:stem-specific protein TSJT1-like [Rhodamnia argentea]|uniref:Stem-specific protein TSJT1-like n=1 Tax=Rhodamnia argentea TaxID=178133 RepID=A0A8B8P2A3_9MYRT|nr:stem-specific protein TSJT1-like [Rhodamnia argentea]